MSGKNITNAMGKYLCEFRSDVERYENLASLGRLSNVRPETLSHVSEENDYVMDTPESMDCTDEYVDENIDQEADDQPINLAAEIAGWVLRHKVPHNHVDDLLCTLIKAGIKNLPKTCKTLLKCDKAPLQISIVQPGEYCHYGIQKYLNSRDFDFLKNLKSISIDIGIDGLNLFKSSVCFIYQIV